MPRVAKARKAPKAYLAPSEVEALEQAATNLRDRLLIILLSHLGGRISEVLGITVEDIDLRDATAEVK